MVSSKLWMAGLVACGLAGAGALPAHAADANAPGMTTVRQGGKDVPATKATQGSNGGQGAMSDAGGPGVGKGTASVGGAGGGGGSAGNGGRRTIGGQ